MTRPEYLPRSWLGISLSAAMAAGSTLCVCISEPGSLSHTQVNTKYLRCATLEDEVRNVATSLTVNSLEPDRVFGTQTLFGDSSP